MSRLAWYWHRLRAMEPGEIVAHARKKAYQWQDTRRLPDWSESQLDSATLRSFPNIPNPDDAPVALREALGYRAPHFPLADHYNTSNWMYGKLAHDKLVDSGDWHEHLDLKTHRYLREDVGLGLAFLVSLSEWAGLGSPVAAGLLAVAGAASGNDFRKSGRTLEAIGLADKSRAALADLLRKGF